MSVSFGQNGTSVVRGSSHWHSGHVEIPFIGYIIGILFLCNFDFAYIWNINYVYMELGYVVSMWNLILSYIWFKCLVNTLHGSCLGRLYTLNIYRWWIFNIICIFKSLEFLIYMVFEFWVYEIWISQFIYWMLILEGGTWFGVYKEYEFLCVYGILILLKYKYDFCQIIIWYLGVWYLNYRHI